MALGDVFQVKDHQLWNNSVECLNVYYYRQVSGDNGAAMLANSFEGTMLPQIVDVQHSAVTHTAIEVINLDDPSDYAVNALTTANQGTLTTGETMPAFVTWSIRLNRTTRAVHHGWKRIVGVPEADVASGVAVAGALVYLANLCGYMTANLGDAVDVWHQRIFRQAKPDAVPPVARADFAIGSAIFTGVSTMNTRKR